MSVDFLVAAAYCGKAPYVQPPMKNINTLGVGWSPLPFHLLKGHWAVEDFEKAIAGDGFRIAIPPLNTSDELTFQRALAFYETSYEGIEGPGRFRLSRKLRRPRRRLEGRRSRLSVRSDDETSSDYRGSGRRSPTHRASADADDLMDHLTKVYGYGRGVIAAKMYPKLQSREIATMFMETIFMIAADVSERLAYEIAKTLITHREQLAGINASMADFDPAMAWRNPPAPMHPGALRAYRELGFAD